MPELALGTVRFGAPYGLDGGRTPRAEVARVLDAARRAGVRLLDTAPAYGDAETLLGELADGFAVVTKTSAAEDLPGSLARLRRDRVHGLLAHRAEDLLGPEGGRLWEAMERRREEGRVERLGASVYTPRELEALLDRFPIDLVQLPANLLDQRFAPMLPGLAARGVRVHVRSIFLQGVLLADPERLPPYFDGLRPALAALRRALDDAGVEPVAAAVGYAASLPVSAAVVGVDDERQLGQVARRFTDPPALPWESFALHDERWILPTRWKLS